jgi:type VI secretion system protein ImpG
LDPRLLRAYNEELAYLRETSREFGAEYDQVAAHLGLKTPEDPDPYVERLLEGVAFLGARVKLKLQDQYPEFTGHLLSAIQPNYLAPTPSMCVVQLEPKAGEGALMEGPVAPRGSELMAAAVGTDTTVEFRTGQAVRLWPLRITEAEYLPSRAAVAAYAAAANVQADAGLRLRFEPTEGARLDQLPIDSLPVYLEGSEAAPGELYRQLLGDCVAAVGRPAGGAFVRLACPEPYGFEDEQALLPRAERAFRGYRLLAEYFACPERFLFADLRDLGRAFAKAEGACDVVLLFRRVSNPLIGAVTPDNIRPFCTPAINLFEMQMQRVELRKYDHEHLVMPDRTRPYDFEVFRITEATAYDRNGGGRPAAPLYALGSQLYDWREAVFYATRLKARRLSTKEQRLRRRADYVGTETWLSLTVPGAPERVDALRELAVRGLVTNRELPELIRFSGGGGSDFSYQIPAVGRVRVARAPTRPRPPLGMADAAWSVIGHLTPNYSMLVPEEGGDASLLRNHLALYGRPDDPMRRQIDGVLTAASEAVTRRIQGWGRAGFARGRRVRLRLDDGAFENGRMFLFASVLERFLSEFVSINSFVETVFESPDQGEFAKWPPRTGLRPTI